ncbi:uncharacterized protein with SCP/PR1 domains [Nostoc sp. PCC 7524]|uniref:CAP domain-containing protein n=1 Tax=Nostoc sp. (strain ATCC 29411 / PCC 7524) TaxID=28072 RepID=UPI00029EDD1E|nr:CAP domain-containing protein [Nostoc sp. PCC 7524]AFY48588.1 uncharacterized protein with SCP/PR1 domains [Nostoc sp. PCC 7524]
MNQLPKKICLLWVAIALLSIGCEQITEQLPPLPNIEIPTSQPPEPLVSPESATAAEMEAAIRRGINQVRQKNGLSPLKDNQKLAQVARKYSRQMSEQKFFSHTGADGSTPQERVLRDGIIYSAVGENLFKSQNVPRPVPAAIEGWMKSPGHRENILRPVFTETGVGVWREGNTYYVTQLFLRPFP